MFRLPVAVGVGDGGEADLGAEAGAVALEDAAGELRAVVRDDAIWPAETAYQPLDEFDGRSGWHPSHGLHLRPLGELVNGDEEEAIAPERSREGAQDIQPLDRERP